MEALGRVVLTGDSERRAGLLGERARGVNTAHRRAAACGRNCRRRSVVSCQSSGKPPENNATDDGRLTTLLHNDGGT
jgi:hypothetical protein